MTKKRHSIEEIAALLDRAGVLLEQGSSISQVAKEIGVTEVTYFRWRKRYGGLRLDQMLYVKNLEVEIVRLRSLVREFEPAQAA